MESVEVTHPLGREFTIDKSQDPLYLNDTFDSTVDCCKFELSHGAFIDVWKIHRGCWNTLFAEFKKTKQGQTHKLSYGCWYAAIYAILSYDYPSYFKSQNTKTNDTNAKVYCKLIKLCCEFLFLLLFFLKKKHSKKQKSAI